MRTLMGTVLSVLVLGSGLARADGVVLPLPPDDQKEIIIKLGQGVVGKALPSKPIDDVSVYFPLQGRALIYQVTAGPNSGKSQTLGLARVKRGNGKMAWRFILSPSLAGFIRQTPGGDLLMPAVTDTGEGVVVTTTPANPFVLKGHETWRDPVIFAAGIGYRTRRPNGPGILGIVKRHLHIRGYLSGESAHRYVRGGLAASQVRRQGRACPYPGFGILFLCAGNRRSRDD